MGIFKSSKILYGNRGLMSTIATEIASEFRSDGIDMNILLDGNSELIPLVSSEIESELFLKGYDICVSPYGRNGKQLSITRYGEFGRIFGNMTAFKIWLIPDEGKIRFKTSVGLYGNKEVPTAWSIFFKPQTRRLVRQHKLTEKSLTIATSVIRQIQNKTN